jgi:hypothetical protein
MSDCFQPTVYHVQCDQRTLLPARSSASALFCQRTSAPKPCCYSILCQSVLRQFNLCQFISCQSILHLSIMSNPPHASRGRRRPTAMQRCRGRPAARQRAFSGEAEGAALSSGPSCRGTAELRGGVQWATGGGNASTGNRSSCLCGTGRRTTAGRGRREEPGAGTEGSATEEL